MKKISILIMVICLILTSSCELKKDDEHDVTGADFNLEGKILKITGISVPSYFAGMANYEDFENISYLTNELNNIEIIFNEEIIDKNYTFAYMQYANYYGIKNEYDEENHIFIKYKVDKNKIIITPKVGYNEAGIISLYIPENLESTSGKRMNNDKMLVFAANILNKNNLYSFENYDLKRDTKSLIQYKRYNDGNRIAFVNKESQFLNDTSATGSLVLERGETVSILDEVDSLYKIEVKFPKKYTKNMFGDDILFEEHSDYCSVIGYVDKNNLIELPEPLNKTSDYYAMPLYDGYNTNVHLIISEKFIGTHEIVIWDHISEVDKEDLHEAEAAAISRLANNFTFGRKYLTIYVDEKGNYDYPPDYEDRHMPQYKWSETDYNTYTKAYNMYCNYLLDYLEDYIFIDTLADIKDNLKKYIANSMLFERTWIDWGYKNKLEDKGYFFKTIKENSPEKISNVIVEPKDSYDEIGSYNEDIVTTLNNINKMYDGERIHKRMSKITKKYILSSITGEIIQIDRENSKFNVVDEYDGESYSILIDDFSENNLNLVEGERISVLCYYDFNKNAFYIDKIE